MRVLFDNSVPRGLAKALQPQVVTEARRAGWDQLHNGELLEAADASGFEVIVTADQNICYQQNLAHRNIALIVLSHAQWPYIRNYHAEIAAAVNEAQPGSYTVVEIRKTRSRA